MLTRVGFPQRYLMNNFDWLEDEIGDYENDYLIFDCPGEYRA